MDPIISEFEKRNSLGGLYQYWPSFDLSWHHLFKQLVYKFTQSETIDWASPFVLKFYDSKTIFVMCYDKRERKKPATIIMNTFKIDYSANAI